MPVASVIIPCYNPNRFLTDAINSVLNQTFTDFEIVVVDDGSSVDVTEFIPLDSRILFVQEAHNGVSISRNIALSLSSGEFVALLDADDLWAPTKLERQIALMQRDPEMSLSYTNVATLDQRRSLGHGTTIGRGDVDVDFARPAIEIIDQCNICTSSVMVRRHCLNACGWFDPLLSYSEDYDLYLRLFRLFPQIGYLETPEVSYRLWDENVSSNYRRAYRFGCLAMERYSRLGLHKHEQVLHTAAQNLKNRLAKFCSARAYDNCRSCLRNCRVLEFSQELYSAFRLSPTTVSNGFYSWLRKRFMRGTSSHA